MKLLVVIALIGGCAHYTTTAAEEPVGESRRPFRQIPPELTEPVAGKLPPAEQLNRARELIRVISTRVAALKDDPDEPQKLRADLEELGDVLPPRPDLQRIADRMLDSAKRLCEASTTMAESDALREQLAAGLTLLRVRLGGGYTVGGAQPR